MAAADSVTVVAPNGKTYRVPQNKLAEVQAALSGVAPQRVPPTAFSPDASAAPPSPVLTEPQLRQKRIDDMLGAARPAGAAIGGLIGGSTGTIGSLPVGGLGGVPGAIQGATIGGMGGEAIRQLLSAALGGSTQESPRAALGAIGAGGVQSGLEEVASAPLGMAARGLSQSLMQGALKPTRAEIQSAMRAGSRRAGRELTAEEANIARTARALKVAPGRVSPAARYGSQKMGTIVQHEAQKLNDALDAAGASGKDFTIQDATKHIGALQVKLARNPKATKLLARLDKSLKELRDSKAVRMPPTVAGKQGKFRRFTPAEFNEFKREWQDIAKTLFENPSKRGGLEQLTAQQLSRGARKELEAIPGQGKQIAASNQRLSELFPVNDAIRNAEIAMTQGSGASLPILPAALTSLAIPAAVRNRGLVGSAALRMDQLAPLLMQSGSGAAAISGQQDLLLNALRAMGAFQPDQTNQ